MLGWIKNLLFGKKIEQITRTAYEIYTDNTIPIDKKIKFIYEISQKETGSAQQYCFFYLAELYKLKEDFEIAGLYYEECKRYEDSAKMFTKAGAKNPSLYDRAYELYEKTPIGLNQNRRDEITNAAIKAGHIDIVTKHHVKYCEYYHTKVYKHPNESTQNKAIGDCISETAVHDRSLYKLAFQYYLKACGFVRKDFPTGKERRANAKRYISACSFLYDMAWKNKDRKITNALNYKLFRLNTYIESYRDFRIDQYAVEDWL